MSKVKFTKVSSFYPEGIEQLYAENPALKFAPYAEQYRRMMDQGIGWADFWIINLNKTENFDATLFIINNEYAQKQWAKENNFAYNEQAWLLEIIIEQVRRTEPEIFFANDYVFLNKVHIKKIKSEVKTIRKTIGWDGIGLCDAERFSECDMILLCNETFLDYYRSNGFISYVFPFGFEQSLLNKLNLTDRKYQISFAGSLTLRNGGHHSRLKVLGAVARSFDVDYWMSSFDSSKPYLIKNILKKIGEGNFSDAADIIKLWQINKGNVFGLEMYQILASSKITLNTHIDTAFQIAGNIRLWEATGVGTCLVTDWKKNLHELFVPDEEVVVYKSPEECVDKINFLLNNPIKMEAIAKAGQKRTLEEYSYEKRIREFSQRLIDFL